MPTHSEKHYEARIVSRREVSRDLWIFSIDPGGPFSFLPGMYATLGEYSGGKLVERAYSIVSAPFEPELEFFFELVPAGALTPHLFKLKVGDRLTCRKIAKGRFLLDLKSGRTNHFLVATVTGVAPFVSYARALYRDWKNNRMPAGHRLFLLQGASSLCEFGYKEELERIASEVPWLKYVSTVSRPWEEPAWQGETGRVDDLVRKYAAEWNLEPERTSAYLCGHPGMVEHARGILQRAGWKKEAISEEIYFVPAAEPIAP